MRYLLLALTCGIAMVQSFASAETLTIVNTAPHDVVIGIYQHTEDGIRERLVPIKSMTEIRNVPIEFAGNECFAIAYKATGEDQVKRATPAVIQGMRKLVSASAPDKQHPQAEIVLQYRASDYFPERDSMGSNLYAPVDGEWIRKEITHTFGDKIVKVDYAQIEIDGKTKP